MGWLAVRAAVDAAIDCYDRFAGGLAQHVHRIDGLQAQAAALAGSASPHVANGLALIGAARGELEQAFALARQAAARCREYLAAVDPHGAAGSVTGLPQPHAWGDVRGGHTDAHGAAPLGRRALSDVSRPRTHVFTEVGPEGFKDLLARDDGLIALRGRWLDAAGHARLRHGGSVSDDRLRERALRGRDPITVSGVDWEHGGSHPPTRHATAYTSDAVAVYAEMALWDSPAGRQARSDAEHSSDPLAQSRFEVSVPAEAVFGEAFRDHIRGWTRQGSQSNPTGVQATDFPDDTVIFALYRREDVHDEWRAYTCYPRVPRQTT